MNNMFEKMIDSVSEQINPVSLSTCYFRCIEFIKLFEWFKSIRQNFLYTQGLDNINKKN